jgi:hypothetical protein
VHGRGLTEKGLLPSAICIDCHGLDAIFRYKYYHDPVERVEATPAGKNIIRMK